MTRMTVAFCCMAVLAGVAVGQVARLPGAEPTTQGEFVFVGKVTSAVSGLASMSEPPRYQFTVQFDVLEMIKGDKPDKMVLRYITTDDKAKVLQVGAKVLVTAKTGRAASIVEGTDEAVKAAGGKSTGDAGTPPASGPAATQAAPTSQPGAKAKTDPTGLPLDARLVVKKDTYTLKADQSGDAFAKKLKDAAKPGGEPPAPPEVDLAFELTNTGKKAITIPLGGDATRLDLKLEGPGAVTVPFAQMMTMEFRLGTPTTIEPGKSITIPVAKLLHGTRGVGNASYWTKAGTYTLTASYVAPIEGLGLKEEQAVTITTAPVTIKVTEK